MTEKDRDRLRLIKTFPQLVKYLRDDLEWPIETDDFEELTFDYDPEELGIDPKNAVKIEEIQQLRPLVTNQPWGIFFVKFGKNKLSVVALRRILSQLVIKKRASMRKADQPSWYLHDLLFISNFCEDEERKITFARFTQNEETTDLPTLKVLGWDEGDTALHIDHVQHELKDKLRWPKNENDAIAWRDQWSSAFTLRHREVITTSKDLAVRLADLAKKIRNRAIEVLAIESEKGPLRKLHKAFREALIHDLSEADFADMYAQTIAYGLLAARVSRPMGIIADNMADMVPITNPFLKEMLSVFLTVGGRKSGINFDELGVQDIVDLLNSPDTHMEDVLRDFGNKTRQEDPVIHFYELFLKEYDPEIKIKRGVFYTPQSVVHYIVKNVHELFQTEFGLEDGLASTITWDEMIKKNPSLKTRLLQTRDESNSASKGRPPSLDESFITIFDPATGTATFLVEVIDIIHKSMTKKWKDMGLNQHQIQDRWNDYVPKHLLPRLYGFELMMAPYAIAHMKIGLKLFETGYRFESNERVRVYLTNSLEPASDSVQRDLTHYSEALAHEAAEANNVKRKNRFTVVIGNPPYSYDSKNVSNFTDEMIAEYYTVDGKSLNERNPKGLQDDFVKFFRYSELIIRNSNIGVFGFITNSSYIDNPTYRGMRYSLFNTYTKMWILNLSSTLGIHKHKFDKNKDENIFDTVKQRVGITLAIRDITEKSRDIFFTEIVGDLHSKEKYLMEKSISNMEWNKILPIAPFWLFFPINLELSGEYERWPLITQIFQLKSLGLTSARDDFTIRWSKEEIFHILKKFQKMNPEEARIEYNLGRDARDWKVSYAQKDILEHGLSLERIVPLTYRPFDRRYTYYTGNSRGFHCMPRDEIMQHMLLSDNFGLCFMRRSREDSNNNFFIGRNIIDKGILSSADNATIAPLFLGKNNINSNLKDCQINISSFFLDRFSKLINNEPYNEKKVDNEIFGKEILNYIYAVFYSQTYRTRYSEFHKIDFPRIPLPRLVDLFKELTPLGSKLIALHLIESPNLNKPITKYIGATPSGEIEKVTYSDNTVWIDKPMTEGFRGVPENIWNFHIGGYQVCEKWLKDRKGRQLSAEDIAHYQKVIVALNETIRIMGEIDAVIEEHGGWPGAFDSSGAGVTEDLQTTEQTGLSEW